MRPLFVGVAPDGLVLSSELVAISGLATKVERMGSGQCGTIHNCSDPLKDGFNFTNFYSFLKPRLNITFEDAKTQIRQIFIQNVKDKIHYGTRNDGFYLSGGLDSSLVAGVAAKLRAPRKLNTFTVGFSPDASDVIYARLVAKHINSVHHEIIISEEDGLAHLEEIIKYLGTFDQTTVRASTPLYLATKWIKEKYPDIYIMYNGELADELQGGYLYFRNAPTCEAHREESIRRLAAVHNFDGLRCDRVCAAFSIEARFPFFSKTLLDFVLSLPPQYLAPSEFNGTEKYLIRDAFRDSGYIPEEVLWRTKNALSDATSVKSSWKDKLKAEIERRVSDEEFSTLRKSFTHAIPDTKEDYYYRKIFEKYYPGFSNTIPYKWLPLWCGDVKDSSASVLGVYTEDDLNTKK
jgi:asparagine synthase (glutamine-hydrolysing)